VLYFDLSTLFFKKGGRHLAHTPYNPNPALRATVQTQAQRLCFPVPSELAGMPVGAFLRRCGVSAKTLRAAKHLYGGIAQNGQHIRTVDPVEAGAIVSVHTGEGPRSYRPAEGIPIEVLYEDDHMIAFNKPAGLNTHPSNRDAADSLLNYAHAHFAQRTFRPLTRLDKQTSGVLLTAKTAFAATALKTLPEKTYLAIAEGELTGRGTIDLPISRSIDQVKQRTVLPGGAASITHYRTLATGGGHSLLLVRLITGRTHQIRVHLKHLGHPLAGDDLYGGATHIIGRQALHGLCLRFTDPFSGEARHITAPLPADFTAACKQLFGGLPAITDELLGGFPGEGPGMSIPYFL
jgi:23S rRNA pseudouridine1911/1915/1917 synthase